MRICSPCLQKKGPQGSGIREMQDLLKCHLRLKQQMQQMQQWHTNTINEATSLKTSKTYGNMAGKRDVAVEPVRNAPSQTPKALQIAAWTP